MYVFLDMEVVPPNSSKEVTVGKTQKINVWLKNTEQQQNITKDCTITSDNSEACLISKGINNQIINAVKEGSANISVAYGRRKPFTFNLKVTAGQTASNMNFEKFIQGLQ